MTISQRDLIYWYKEFKPLLSGWTVEEQILFHKHAIATLRTEMKKRGTK